MDDIDVFLGIAATLVIIMLTGAAVARSINDTYQEHPSTRVEKRSEFNARQYILNQGYKNPTVLQERDTVTQPPGDYCRASDVYYTPFLAETSDGLVVRAVVCCDESHSDCVTEHLM